MPSQSVQSLQGPIDEDSDVWDDIDTDVSSMSDNRSDRKKIDKYHFTKLHNNFATSRFPKARKPPLNSQRNPQNSIIDFDEFDWYDIDDVPLVASIKELRKYLTSNDITKSPPNARSYEIYWPVYGDSAAWTAVIEDDYNNFLETIFNFKSHLQILHDRNIINLDAWSENWQHEGLLELLSALSNSVMVKLYTNTVHGVPRLRTDIVDNSTFSARVRSGLARPAQIILLKLCLKEILRYLKTALHNVQSRFEHGWDMEEVNSIVVGGIRWVTFLADLRSESIEARIMKYLNED
jgi:hypothetical protein